MKFFVSRPVFVLSAALILVACGQQNHVTEASVKSGIPGMTDNTVGNGGKVLRCYTDASDENGNAIQQPHLLEYFEAERLRGWTLEVPDHSEIANEKARITQNVSDILSRMSKFDPKRESHLKGYLNSFFEEATFLKNTELPSSDDTGAVRIPGECNMLQAVVQTKPDFTGSPRYLISSEVWNVLDIKSRTGLVLHEIIYREGLRRGHINSISTRHLTSFLSSDKMKTISPEAFKARLVETGFTIFVGATPTNWNPQFNLVFHEEPRTLAQTKDECSKFGGVWELFHGQSDAYWAGVAASSIGQELMARPADQRRLRGSVTVESSFDFSTSHENGYVVYETPADVALPFICMIRKI